MGSGLCPAEKAWAGSQREGGRAEGEEQTGGQLCAVISAAASPQEPPGRVWGLLHRSLTALSGMPHGRPEVRGSRRSRGTRPGGSLENTPSRHRATRLTSCSSASTPRAERTKPRSGRSADTDAPTPCAGLLVLVLTFDGNSAMALGSPRRSGRAPGAAPGLQLRLRLRALRGIPGQIRQVRDAPPHDALGLAPL